MWTDVGDITEKKVNNKNFTQPFQTITEETSWGNTGSQTQDETLSETS